MAVVATDAFTAANGTALPTYNANWEHEQGTFAINTNAVYSSAASENLARYSGSAWNNDQYSQLVLAALSSSALIGVAVRAQNSANGYCYYVDNSNQYWWKMVSGSYTSIGDSATDPAVSDTIYIEIQGTTLVVKLNTTTNYSGTQTNWASGSAGLCGYGNASTTRGDNWEGGDFTSGGTGNPWYYYAQQ